jgi:ankyrin repeat protein
MVAAAEGHVGVLELLISRQAKIEAADSKGMTALSWACVKGQAQAANCLLEHQKGGADINHADKAGMTPLDLAAQVPTIKTFFFRIADAGINKLECLFPCKTSYLSLTFEGETMSLKVQMGLRQWNSISLLMKGVTFQV